MHALSWCAPCLAAAAAVALSPAPGLEAQIQAVNPQIRHATGQNVAPVYEGWYQAEDGTTHASFGYFNRNSEEVVHVPIGPENKVDPGPADQGQPTRFIPGRQHGVFTIVTPKDKPRTEVVWALTVSGRTLAIPANFDQQYVIEPLKETGGNFPGNTPPVLKFEAAGRSTKGPAGMTIARTAMLSKPLPLDVWVTDDGLPPVTERGGSSGQRRGLSVTWSQYRGSGTVTFSNSTPAIEQGKASTAATFSEPGDYTLRVLASDGSGFSAQCCWTNGYVKVTVSAGEKP